MSLEDIKREWRNEMERSISPSEFEQLLNVVQGRCADLERQVHGRDVREILAALIVIGAFAAMWPIYRASPAAILGVTLIVCGAGFIVYSLLSARTPAPTSFQASVLECSRNRLAWLDRQISLLNSVLWWYVAPICLGCLLFGWGLTGGSPLAFGFHAVIILAIGAGIVRLNQWTVRRNLQPLRDEVVRLIENLERVD
jgi:hypothetical protein